jgi:hypothetical protein
MLSPEWWPFPPRVATKTVTGPTEKNRDGPRGCRACYRATVMETPSAPMHPAPWARSLSALLRALPLAWAAAITLYLLVSEGLFDWRPVGGPSAPERLLQGRFSSVLRHLTGPYRVWWDNVPWMGLAWAVLALLAYLALGWLLLTALEIYLPRLGTLCVSLALGMGVAGVAFELLTMAGQLHRVGAACTWLALFAAASGVRAVALEGRHRRLPGPVPHLEWARRLSQARRYEKLLIAPPSTGFERWGYAACITLTVIISLLVGLHAIGQAETYWDSLILYMGYARKMFLEQGFPRKVVGQVGIGLGANYPHLYPLLTAQTAALAGHWSDSFAQLLPPVAGAATTVLVYLIAEQITRDQLGAAACTLLYRAVPYGMAYNQYASDYALAIFFTAAFMYMALMVVRHGLPAYYWLMLLMAAFAVHINYLMWVLWLTAPVAMAAALARRKPDAHRELETRGRDLEEGTVLEVQRPSWAHAAWRPTVGGFLATRACWLPVIAALAVAAPWYIRNIVVTGNPVYAFYYGLFPSRNVNPEVMRSAELEWLMNGDGLGRVGRTMAGKLGNSWMYFVTGGQAWKLAPVFVAFVLPGFIVFLARAARAVNRREDEDALRFGVPCAFLFLLLWFYAYAVADFYLYQIIVVLPLFGVFAAFVYGVLRGARARVAYCALALVVGFAPGVVMGLMGFKLTRGSEGLNAVAPQLQLTALRNLFLDRQFLLRMQFGGDVDMIQQLNLLPAGTTVLTHENRHLLLDEKLRIVHLDDWEMQQAYRKPVGERLRIIDAEAVDYYLHVPNEDKHRANSLLGMDELVRLGHFVEVSRTESPDGGTRDGLDYRAIPAGRNVLYRRAGR